MIKNILSLILLTNILAVVISVEAANNIKGQSLFMQHCNNCHEPGNSVPGSPDFSDINTMMQPDSRILKNIKTGQGAMPAYEGILRENEILDVIAYMRTL